MGELFERLLPVRPFDWTGERLTSAVSGQVEVEHLHRYFLARSFCRGFDVLDLAAGEGYGSALLAQVATSVVGVEIDSRAVRHARECYTLPNLRYETGDARAIPLPDASFDRVVSFETIEHLYEQETFLGEVRRVLRPGGIFICSSPDRDHYSPRGSPPNPHHVRELTKEEFKRVIADRFAHVQLLAQRPIVGSVLVPADGEGASNIVTFDRRSDNRFEMSDGVARPLYWVAVASDTTLPAPVQSCYFDTASIDDAMAAPNLTRRHDELTRCHDELTRCHDELTRCHDELTRGHDELTRGHDELKRCHHELRAYIDKQQENFAQQRATFAGQLEDSEASLNTSRTRLAETQFHLERLNRYGWTRIGLFVDRQLKGPAKLLGLYKPEAPITVPARMVPSANSINLPSVVAEPDVSVVILSYAQCDYTLRCLASIAALDGTSTLEVILSDDCSKAPGLADIAQIANLRFIEPLSNLGFLQHANWAVGQSKGKYVYLLNNDTELQHGAIDALRAIAEATPEAGLVGSKLVYPDGRLQEAGGIIWDDGSAWNYGHSDDPERPEYNYVRDAGYISGASILVPRKVWDELGGFDERYAPAYCEDSDFAFRVRKSGRRVLYAPKSVVVHHEGISHGTDLESGMKAYQVRNTQTLKERWAKVLKVEHLPPGTDLMRARDSARSRRIVLIVDHYVPEPDRDAGSRTIIEMIKSLQRGGVVVKFWPDNLFMSVPYTASLQSMGVEVFYGPVNVSFNEWPRANAHQLDLVLLNRPTIAPRYLAALKLFAPTLPCVFYGHDLHSERMRAQAGLADDASLLAEAAQMEQVERHIWREVDVVTYPSIAEIQFVQAIESNVVARVIQPYCFDHFPAERTPIATQNLLFVGGFAHSPNIDAVLWFTQDVFPLVLAQAPKARLCIAGSNPASSVVALARDNIEITGSLSTEALSARYATARVAVVPLRYGAGVKLKVVEALHAALPLVTTAIGAQGIPGLEKAAIVTDGPQEFADSIARLLTDDALWIAQSNRQRALAEANFSRERSVQNMSDIVETALKHKRALED